MFRVSQHPSSGVLKTVTATSGTGHNIGTATSLQRGLIGREVAVPVLWPVPEVAVTVFSTPDDGCCDTRNMYSDFAVNKYLHTVASGWIFINTELRCTEPWVKKFMSLVIKFYFTSSMLNMFRTLIHPTSGACDFSIVSPHWPCVPVSICDGVSVWLDWGGIRVAGWSTATRIPPTDIKLITSYSLDIRLTYYY